MGSRIIFSIDLGPRHVLITSATVYRESFELQFRMSETGIRTFAAVMFEI